MLLLSKRVCLVDEKRANAEGNWVMVILPLACTLCGKRVDIYSFEPMLKCPDCLNKMRPAGKVRELTQKEAEEVMREYGSEVTHGNGD